MVTTERADKPAGLPYLDVQMQLIMLRERTSEPASEETMSDDEIHLRWELDRAGAFPKYSSIGERENYVCWLLVKRVTVRWKRSLADLRPPLWLRLVVAWRLMRARARARALNRRRGR